MNNVLALIEQHVEKGVLGLAAAFAAVSAYLFLLQSPNTVSYQGATVGPRELHDRILAEARNLEEQMRTAKPPEVSVEKLSDQIRKRHAAGIFEPRKDGMPLPRELRAATMFGKKIEVPGLSEAEENSGDVALVSPLAPSQPIVITGRSLVVKKPVRLDEPASGGPAPPPAPTADSGKPVETVWASVAVYFDKKAQYAEMIAAGYAPYRARAYVVGLEVERQERLSTGEWSEWTPTKPSMAMPTLSIPEPVIEDATGKLVNKEELDKTFRLIKSQQNTLMQPAFYDVKAGDFWEIPPLTGFEPPEEDEAKEKEEKSAPPSLPPAPTVGGGRRSPGLTFGGGGGRTSGGGVTFGGGGGGRSLGPPRPPAPAAEDQSKREQLKRLNEEIGAAALALNKGDFSRAIEISTQIENNQVASKGHKKKAEKIRKRAEYMRERRAKLGTTLETIVKHPETGAPALWVHDDSVEPGKTYRYRARVRLWNRYVGQVRAVKSPEQARQAVMAGEWSLPSAPVTVTPGTYFYVRGPKVGAPAASMEVWGWREGTWIQQTFDVEVGDVIGGVRTVRTGELDAKGEDVRADVDFTTGAIVLDIRNENVPVRLAGKDGAFTYSEKPSLVVTYLDPADGQVKEKAQALDRDDRTRKELIDQEV
ncbi:MAG: hypothetical protein HRF50_06755 [Phycisphaerae bacterium]|jgi:hypothetical protein